MKVIFTSLLMLTSGFAFAQLQLANPGFENWGGNPSPGVSSEPTNWYSNKSGSTTAQIGPQTCFQDNAIKHSGNSSARVETITTGPPFNVVVNGNVTTGVINAPSFTKSDGYIGTQNYDDTSGDVRRMAFTGKPDSLVGWYQYNQGGHATEQGKIRVILHKGQYYDPETPTTYHPACVANKIADAAFTTPASDMATWTRFSVPFNWVDTSLTPAYAMVNITSSADQLTNNSGSKFWIDDLEMIYNPPPSQHVNNVTSMAGNVHAYAHDRVFYVDFLNRDNKRSMITVYDLTGRVILSESISNSALHSFDMSGYSTGVYVYRIYCDGQAKSGKFILE